MIPRVFVVVACFVILCTTSFLAYELYIIDRKTEIRTIEISNTTHILQMERMKQELTELFVTELNKLKEQKDTLEEKYWRVVHCNNINRAKSDLNKKKQKFQYLPQSQYEQLECSKQINSQLKQNDILFGVVTGAKNKIRYEVAKRTWAKDIPIFFQSDSLDPDDSRVFTTPRTVGTNSYQKSQLKFFDAIIQAHNNSDFYNNYKWFFLCDDDTHVNIHALLNFAEKWDTRMPVIFCFVWDTLHYGAKFCSGGGGSLISKEALSLLGKGFLTNFCDTNSVSDVTIARCAHRNNVMLVHSNLFHAFQPEKYENKLQRAPFVESISYHYTSPDIAANYTNLQVQYWNSFYEDNYINDEKIRPILKESDIFDVMDFVDEYELKTWKSDDPKFCLAECLKIKKCNWWRVSNDICTLRYKKGHQVQTLQSQAVNSTKS